MDLFALIAHAFKKNKLFCVNNFRVQNIIDHFVLFMCCVIIMLNMQLHLCNVINERRSLVNDTTAGQEQNGYFIEVFFQFHFIFFPKLQRRSWHKNCHTTFSQEHLKIITLCICSLCYNQYFILLVKDLCILNS